MRPPEESGRSPPGLPANGRRPIAFGLWTRRSQSVARCRLGHLTPPVLVCIGLSHSARSNQLDVSGLRPKSCCLADLRSAKMRSLYALPGENSAARDGDVE